MMPSRPNVVEYQGMPAYGYGPSPVAVVSMCRSPMDRHRISFTIGLEVSMVAVVAAVALYSRLRLISPSKNERVDCLRPRPETVVKMFCLPPGGRRTVYVATLSPMALG